MTIPVKGLVVNLLYYSELHFAPIVSLISVSGWCSDKGQPDRVETCLNFGNDASNIAEISPITTETTTETILKLIRENPKITIKQIASVCGISDDGVSYHIKKLKQSGKIIRVGGSRNGGEWKVV